MLAPAGLRRRWQNRIPRQRRQKPPEKRFEPSFVSWNPPFWSASFFSFMIFQIVPMINEAYYVFREKTYCIFGPFGKTLLQGCEELLLIFFKCELSAKCNGCLGRIESL
jgi:hypothetical protein